MNTVFNLGNHSTFCMLPIVFYIIPGSKVDKYYIKFFLLTSSIVDGNDNILRKCRNLKGEQRKEFAKLSFMD